MLTSRYILHIPPLQPKITLGFTQSTITTYAVLVRNCLLLLFECSETLHATYVHAHVHSHALTLTRTCSVVQIHLSLGSMIRKTTSNDCSVRYDQYRSLYFHNVNCSYNVVYKNYLSSLTLIDHVNKIRSMYVHIFNRMSYV